MALDSIRIVMEDFYKQNYPDCGGLAKTSESTARSIRCRRSTAEITFPKCGVSWKKFPDNLGHLYYKGCFRCHDGKHVSDDGKVLSRDCNTCHTILAQQFENDSLRISLAGIEYRHPVDIGDAWKEMNCSDCHNPSDQ